MGDNLAPINFGEVTSSPSTNPSKNPSKNPTSNPTLSSLSPSTSPSQNPTAPTILTSIVECRKWDRNSQECALLPGCRYVFPTNADFKKLKRTFIRKCMNLGDFGCRAQTDCVFKCAKLKKFDKTCRRLFFLK